MEYMRPIHQKGFTLIELVIASAIMGVLMSIVLLQTSSFGSYTIVKTEAYRMLDLIEETRRWSVNVKEFTANQRSSYGLYFDTANPQRIIVYADCVTDDNGDGTLDSSDEFEYSTGLNNCGVGTNLAQTFTLDPKVRITDIRSISFGVPASETSASVEYLRPEPTVWISNSSGSLLDIGQVEITISDVATGDFSKTIVIQSAGQTYIE